MTVLLDGKDSCCNFFDMLVFSSYFVKKNNRVIRSVSLVGCFSAVLDMQSVFMSSTLRMRSALRKFKMQFGEVALHTLQK